MIKRAFLIHGFEGYPQEGWRPWLKKELEKHDFSVLVPAMPDVNHPRLTAWVEHLSKVVRTTDDQCYFVGHSLGAIAILRYLETLTLKQKIGGCVFVAGFTESLGNKELKTFFTKPILWNKIKNHCKKFVAIASDNDPWVSLKYTDIFKKKLHAEVIIMENMKHFSGDDGILELPVALDSILKLS